MHWYIDSIVVDAGKEAMSFLGICFRHIGRDDNIAANFMASNGHHYNSPTIFFPPYDVAFSLLVQKDILDWPSR